MSQVPLPRGHFASSTQQIIVIKIHISCQNRSREGNEDTGPVLLEILHPPFLEND